MAPYRALGWWWRTKLPTSHDASAHRVAASSRPGRPPSAGYLATLPSDETSRVPLIIAEPSTSTSPSPGTRAAGPAGDSDPSWRRSRRPGNLTSSTSMWHARRAGGQPAARDARLLWLPSWPARAPGITSTWVARAGARDHFGPGAAQMAALGISGPSWPAIHPERRLLVALAFTVGGAALFRPLACAAPIPQRRSSASVPVPPPPRWLVVIALRRREHIKVLWADPHGERREVGQLALLYAVIGRPPSRGARPLVEISFDPDAALAHGRRPALVGSSLTIIGMS